ncbi:hypothetical protein [Gillisia sp. Hel_I_86]|uniref:hypothetical protein n=1 Tax=Gillisia sp. Hel_I_86 TaxID=1249981 RepID=UPI0011A22755|nr:hypothetical protein [Gillisia sp. Hel_I_86]
MQKIVLLLLTVLLSLSCMNDDDFPQVENITKGKKWTLKIGSSPSEVYEQLQVLNIEKQFNTINVTYRKPYSKPEEIQSDISLYNSISLETTFGVLERILITFEEDKVISIEKGGGLLDYVQKWPENQPNNISINIDDSVDIIIEKLIAIYQIPTYQDYQITLPPKLLSKPYDPDMKNYDEWFFSFFENVSFNKDGRNSVKLYFKNDKLIKINNVYEEFEFVN